MLAEDCFAGLRVPFPGTDRGTGDDGGEPPAAVAALRLVHGGRLSVGGAVPGQPSLSLAVADGVRAAGEATAVDVREPCLHRRHTGRVEPVIAAVAAHQPIVAVTEC